MQIALPRDRYRPAHIIKSQTRLSRAVLLLFKLPREALRPPLTQCCPRAVSVQLRCNFSTANLYLPTHCFFFCFVFSSPSFRNKSPNLSMDKPETNQRKPNKTKTIKQLEGHLKLEKKNGRKKMK